MRDELTSLFALALRGGPEWRALVAEGQRREAERFEAWVASGRCTLSADEIERCRACAAELGEVRLRLAGGLEAMRTAGIVAPCAPNEVQEP